jgi:hypothetical protein
MQGSTKYTVTVVAALILAVVCPVVDAFGLQQSQFAYQRSRTLGKRTSKNYGRSTTLVSSSTRTTLYQSNGDSDFMKDQRKGMADAFAGLNSLNSLDETEDEELDEEFKQELFADMMGDLSDIRPDVSTTVDPAVVEDVDGIGSLANNEPVLTTGDIANDILNQDIEPLPNIKDVMSSAFQEAVDGLEARGGIGDSGFAAELAKSVMEDPNFKKEIGEIFDQAAEEMKKEIEVMRKEQVC